jgi:uncharacterized protein (DUF58 family)
LGKKKATLPRNPFIRPSERQIERHLNLPLIPVLVVFLAIMYGLTGYRGWFVIFLGIAGAWLIAAIWMRSLERNLRIERKIHHAWAAVGESVPEQLKLINNGWLPAIWVEISDSSASLESPIRMVSEIAQHSSRTRYLSHLFKHRGLYNLGPTCIRSGDPFGIYTLTLHDQHANTILVTPPILPLNHISISPGGWAGDENRRLGIVKRNISDAGVRNYLPGDSLQRIHWPASAHFDTLIVRQLEAASSKDWCIYVDLDASVQAGNGKHTTLELSIILAASLAVRGLRERRRIGLVLAGPRLEMIESSADPAHRLRILRALSMADTGSVPLSDLLSTSHHMMTSTSILITPSTNPSWVAAAKSHCRGGNVVAFMINSTDFRISAEQKNIPHLLTQSRIPYFIMPGSLLERAYSRHVA